MKYDKNVILLAGPTASGKSKLAIKLAKHLKGEIINADSMQVYKEISILTSKPKNKDIKIIGHHLYGFHSIKKNFSTGAWLRLAIKKINEQWNKGKTPVVVGGTGLYFKALTDGLVKIPNIPESIRKEIRKFHAQIGQKKFYGKLIKIDNLAKKFISSSDSQRTLRAYEVKKYTGKSLFDFKKETKSNFNNNVFKKLFINTPKELLHKKIEKKVEEMFRQGVIEEVKLFSKMKINKHLSSNKIIGIKEISDYLENNINLDQAKELIKLKTRQYAKRQYTWARGHMKSWDMIYSYDLQDLFKKVINKIS
tara:strand:+ start:385 stop:1308 length:924 start_codon:yes stop_codon:yes gene_type:complete